MSDLAFVEVGDSQGAPAGRKIAVVAPMNDEGPAFEATVSGLLSGIEGVDAVVPEGPPARALASSDAVVIVNPVISASNPKLWRIAALSVKARLTGKPLALVGVSVWGLHTAASRAMARTIAANADLLLLKDEASADALAAAGVEPPFRIGADPAWAQLDDLYAAKAPADQVVVALDTVIDLRDSARFEDELAATLEPVAASGLEVLLQPWPSGGADDANVAVARNVAARLGSGASIIGAPASLADARDVYSGSRVVLALRLHAVMAAACAGSRALALTDDPTLERLSHALSMPSVPVSSDPSALSAAILSAAESSPATAAAVRQHIDRAKGSIDLVRMLLTEGASVDSTADPLPLYPNPWRS